MPVLEQDKTQKSVYLGAMMCVVVVVVVSGKAKVRSFLRLFYTTTVTHICLIEHM